MEQRLILISGFGGTGKSTSAKLLFDKFDSCALVEADHLSIIKPWAIGEKLGRIKLRNSLDIIRNFFDEKYKNVICVGLVWSQAELDAVLKHFSSEQYNHFLFWLEASKSTRYERVIKRSESGDTKEFLEEVDAVIANPWPFALSIGCSELINTENLTPEAVANLILQHL